MVYQPPAGARDLLPLEVSQKISIERCLQERFTRYGYHRIITSTLERIDTLMAGGAIQRSTVLQLQAAEEEELGLRPELTASIARAAVTRMAGSQWPLRLYYTDNVFRQGGETGHGKQQEFYQAGVELLGAAGVAADAEILLLLSECLQSLGLSQWHLILGEAGLTRSLLAPFPPPVRDRIRKAIANLDRVGLETMPLPEDLRRRALFLFDLRGKPETVLSKVSTLDLDGVQQEAVNNLKSLIELLRESQSKTHPLQMEIQLDLSFIHTFDYYTGIVFEVVSQTAAAPRVLGQGGRYDELLGLYDPQRQNYPGIGFSLFLEDLHQILLTKGLLPQQTPASDWLVVPTTPQAYTAAFVYAQKLRESPDLVRVEVELGSQDTPEAIRDYAHRCRIRQIAWVNTQGTPEIETL